MNNNNNNKTKANKRMEKRTTALLPATSQLFTCTPARISSFKITLLAPEEAASSASVRVTRPWAQKGGYADTALDPKFGKEGVLHRSLRCVTCGCTWRACSSHTGVLELPEETALFNPTFSKRIEDVLNAIVPIPCSDFVSEGESGHLLAFHTSESSRKKALENILLRPWCAGKKNSCTFKIISIYYV